MRGPRRASTAGRSVSDAASTNPTASRIPSALVRNGWLGTTMTAASAASTATPLTSTALPALSIVAATASTGSRPERGGGGHQPEDREEERDPGRGERAEGDREHGERDRPGEQLGAQHRGLVL